MQAARGCDDARGAVTGVGDVGGALARLLQGSGARVLVSDIDRERAGAVAARCGGATVDPDAVYGTECDVYAPGAVGATLNERTIPQLRCRVVAGPANNQLEVPEDAERLRARGILYAPDYIINGGGAMSFGLMEQGILDRADLESRVRAIGGSLAAIFRDADAAGCSPVGAARARALRAMTGDGAAAVRAGGRAPVR